MFHRNTKEATPNLSSFPNPAMNFLLAFSLAFVNCGCLAFYFPLATIATDGIYVVDAVREAMLPKELDSTVAVGISELVAGGISAAVLENGFESETSNFSSFFPFDKNPQTLAEDISASHFPPSTPTIKSFHSLLEDNLMTKISSTGAYFGTRGILKTMTTLAGVPGPLAVPASSLVATVISTGTKAAARFLDIELHHHHHPADTLLDIDPEVELMRTSEICADVTKWLVYDVLESQIHRFIPNQDLAQLLPIFFAGFLAAAASRKLEALLDPGVRADLPSLQKTALEGGILFTVFHVVLKSIHAVVPESLNAKYPLNEAVETLEEEALSML